MRLLAVVVGAAVVGMLGFVLFRDDSPGSARPTPEPTATASPTTTGRSATTTTLTVATTTTVPAIVAQVDAMSLEAKAGQLIVLGFSGSPSAQTLDLLADGGAGAVFVAARSGNVTDAAATGAMLEQLRRAASSSGVGLLVMTDQEGGRVAAMGPAGLTAFPAPDRFGQLADALGTETATALVVDAYRVIGAELVEVGVDIDLAPVADVNTVGDRGAIRDRSFHSDAAVAATLTGAAVAGLHEGGAAATVKHFPGHGATTVDSHRQLPVLDTPIGAWLAGDAVPFMTAIEAGVELVMIGHLAFPQLDDVVEPRPATLSPAIVAGLLREDLGFDGVVITDDLTAMAPVVDLPLDEVVLRALGAGADLLLTPPDPMAARAAIVAAVADGRLSEAHLDESVRRILVLKEQLARLTPEFAARQPDLSTIDGPARRANLSAICAAAAVDC